MLRSAQAAALIALGLLSAGCPAKKAETAVEAKPAEAAAPRFYGDLGPATVDVSAYPETQRQNYKVFVSVCGTCHSTARPLNSPYKGRDTWQRYARRMHSKMESRSLLPSRQDEERILDFLVFDSEARKTAKSAEFAAQQEDLKKRFEALPK